MRKVVVVLAAMFAFVMGVQAANPIAGITRARAREDLKQQLMKMYEGRYTAVEAMLEEGMNDFDTLCEVPDTEADNEILRELLKLHYPNFSGILVLYQSNKESYARLSRD